MSDSHDGEGPGPQSQRRPENLQAVFRHLQTQEQRKDQSPASFGQSPLARRLSTWGPAGVALVVILGKLKWILIAFKFLKLQTLLTMVLSIGVYSLHFGLPFAAGLVLLIFVHEMGHALAMKRLGIPAGAPVFIPFVGAVIAMKGLPRDAWVEALVGIAGPLLGTAGALVCLIVAWIWDSNIWYVLAYVGFFINLFNMIPLSPLDGGRIVGVVSRWLWVVGYAVCIAVFFMTYSPILFLILLLGLFNLRRTVRGAREGYFDVPPARRAIMGAAYFGLVAFLVLGIQVTEGPRGRIPGGPGNEGVPTTEGAEGPRGHLRTPRSENETVATVTTVRRAGETPGRSGRAYSFVGQEVRFD